MPETNTPSGERTVTLRLGYRKKPDKKKESRNEILKRLVAQSGQPNRNQFFITIIDQLADVNGRIDLRDLTLTKKQL